MNRRGMEVALAKEISRARRDGRPFCVTMVDIDCFKRINDTYGHDVGDKVLCSLTNDLEQRLRGTDHVGRWGGEEFVLVLHDTLLDDAKRLLDELRCHIAREREGLPQFTISAGVVEYCSGMTAEDMVAAADANIYEAKKTGRNRVVV